MATLEAVMYDNTMYEHVGDTEMVIDHNKTLQAENDIDIDLDFVEHGAQDEVMEEEDLIGDYDLELDDAAVTEEQDAEMTDESGDDQLVDEEITDAPVAQIPDMAQTLEDEMLSAATVNDAHEQVVNVQEPSNTSADYRAAHVQSELLAADAQITSANATSPPVAIQDNQEEIAKPEEEPEELITWESDEEGEEEIEEHSKVGETAIEAVLESNIETIKPTEVIEPQTSEETKIEEQSAEKEETEQVEEGPEHEQEVATYNEVQVAGDDAASVSGFLHNEFEGAVQDLPAEVDDTDDHEQPAFDAAALEQLHPIVVRYLEDEMSLFPPTIEEEHTIFFLAEKKLAFENCESVFKAFRDVLGQNVPQHESLVLECPDLQLEIHEGVPECSTLSIAQLLHLHLGLSHNDGLEQPGPLLVVLKHHQDVSARLNSLYELLSEGKGLSALTSSGVDDEANEVVHNEFDRENLEVSEENGEVAGEGEQDQFADDGAGEDIQQPGYATPAHKPDTVVDDEEIDFTSPVNVQKHSAFGASHTARGNGIGNNQQQAGDNIATSAVLEQSPNNADILEEITYDDEEESTYVEEVENIGELDDAVQQPADASDLLDTNIATNQPLANTNDSNFQAGAPSLDKDVPLPPAEHDFDLEDNTGLNTGANENVDLDDSITVGKPATNVSSAVPASKDVYDDLDEIDYSDEDQPAMPPPNAINKDAAIPKPQSPKRSIDEVEESPRDSKRLRSS